MNTTVGRSGAVILMIPREFWRAAIPGQHRRRKPAVIALMYTAPQCKRLSA